MVAVIGRGFGSRGVTDPDLLQACIVDVGCTRDVSFAETAVAVQARNDSNWESDLDKRSR